MPPGSNAVVSIIRARSAASTINCMMSALSVPSDLSSWSAWVVTSVIMPPNAGSFAANRVISSGSCQ